MTGRSLTKAHISAEQTPKMVCYLGGSLIKVSKGLTLEGVGGGRRGKIISFSRPARRRLMYRVNTVDRVKLPVFVTLTYPDNFPRDPKRWSRDVDTFRRWFQRMGWGAIWKKELKPRKSGKNEGEVAPHFHMFVWGASVHDLSKLIPPVWYRIVGSNDPQHLAHGSEVEPIRSPNGVKSYASKYLCKEDEEKACQGDGLGRFWGVINRKVVPFVDPVEVELTRDEVNQLYRAVRRYMHLGRRCKMQLPGITLICDASQWFDNLEGLTRPWRAATRDRPGSGFPW